MISKNEMQIERNRLNQLFKNFSEQGKTNDTYYTLGALHVLEWILNEKGEPISELILFKYKSEKKA